MGLMKVTGLKKEGAIAMANVLSLAYGKKPV